jgi:tetratricopeptide (TPR) repeat protein
VGLLLERAGRLDAALQHGRQLAHRTGRYLPLTLTQVRQQVARGNFAKARALWPAPGTELKEGEWESLSATGWAYVRAGRWDEAVYFFQWALREQPRWARWFHAYLATTHRAAGHLAAARAHAQAAVDLDDQFAPGWTELGLAWEVEGQSDKAQAAYRRALAADPYCPVTHAALSRLEEGPPRELPGAIEWLW